MHTKKKIYIITLFASVLALAIAIITIQSNSKDGKINKIDSPSKPTTSISIIISLCSFQNYIADEFECKDKIIDNFNIEIPATSISTKKHDTSNYNTIYLQNSSESISATSSKYNSTLNISYLVGNTKYASSFSHAENGISENEMATIAFDSAGFAIINKKVTKAIDSLTKILIKDGYEMSSMRNLGLPLKN